MKQTGKKRPYKLSYRREVITCGCGCGKQFVAPVGTRPPKYLDNAHKQRAYRNRKAARELGSEI